MSWLPGLLLRQGRALWGWPTLVLLLWLATAALAQPTDNDYRLGPGDRIIIKVFGEEDLSMDVRLNDTGRLNYPFLGELVVQGLTVTELEQLITRGLKGSYLRDPTVTVLIGEYRPFFVNGEVQRPGGFPYQPKLTVEQAIALGGGFTQRGSHSKIDVIRASDPQHKPVRVGLADPVFPGDIITVKQSIF
jgi:protein involved in polysaccharide export with SLBB domain